jgi:hypothetical protein
MHRCGSYRGGGLQIIKLIAETDRPSWGSELVDMPIPGSIMHVYVVSDEEWLPFQLSMVATPPFRIYYAFGKAYSSLLEAT